MKKSATSFAIMLVAIATVAMTGCASVMTEASVIAKNDAIDDYIKVAELKQVDAIRKRGEFHQAIATEKYIILSDQRSSYLVTFSKRCRELGEHEITPDIRHDLSTLRARFDTYRGCRIQSLYELGDGQAQEILGLGEEPGK